MGAAPRRRGPPPTLRCPRLGRKARLWGQHARPLATVGPLFRGEAAARGDEPDWQAVGRDLATDDATELEVSPVLDNWATEPMSLPELGVDAAFIGWEPPNGAAPRTQRAAWLTLETASTIVRRRNGQRRPRRDGYWHAQPRVVGPAGRFGRRGHDAVAPVPRRHVGSRARPEQTGQVIELMQVSALTPDSFDSETKRRRRRKARWRPAGPLRCLYRRSWRANDWLRGRWMRRSG